MTTLTDTVSSEQHTLSIGKIAMFLAMGIVFGIILTKSEVISWFRIQEMFRFQAFHMYGVIGSAIAVGAISIALIKRYSVKSIDGTPISIEDKPYDRGYNQWFGGSIFGLGWAMTGACPGPLYALIGNGALVLTVSLLFAAAGAVAYGYLKPKLPH